uniref:Uncharacterized protein n=1 Tax=Chelydra serpentina TaxID=8475 RepID=A0A8C3SDR6_CHESE
RHPGGRQPGLRPLQPQAQPGAERAAAGRPALPLRPALADPGPARPGQRPAVRARGPLPAPGPGGGATSGQRR